MDGNARDEHDGAGDAPHRSGSPHRDQYLSWHGDGVRAVALGIALGVVTHDLVVVLLRALGAFETPESAPVFSRALVGWAVAGLALIIGLSPGDGDGRPASRLVRRDGGVVLASLGSVYFALTLLDPHVLGVLEMASPGNGVHGSIAGALDVVYHLLGPVIAAWGLYAVSAGGS
jgi:hypothetical protein